MDKLFLCIKSVEECKSIDLELPDIINKHCSLYRYERQTISLLSYKLLGKILLEHGYSINDLKFLDTGKPIMNDLYVSISHVKDFIAVSFSKIEHGIDLECVNFLFNKKKDNEKI